MAAANNNNNNTPDLKRVRLSLSEDNYRRWATIQRSYLTKLGHAYFNHVDPNVPNAGPAALTAAQQREYKKYEDAVTDLVQNDVDADNFDLISDIFNPAPTPGVAPPAPDPHPRRTA